VAGGQIWPAVRAGEATNTNFNIITVIFSPSPLSLTYLFLDLRAATRASKATLSMAVPARPDGAKAGVGEVKEKGQLCSLPHVYLSRVGCQ